MLERAAQERGLRNVLFKPYQPRDMLDLSLTVADVHLVSLDPSLEGLIVPSKFYGVTAAGRATLFIGSLTGSIGSFIHSAGCGEAVVPGGVSVMVDLIRGWARDPAQVRAMGTRAREWFDRNGEMRVAIGAWERVMGALVVEPALSPVAKSAVR